MKLRALMLVGAVALAAIPTSSDAQIYVGSGEAFHPELPYEFVFFAFDPATGSQVETRCRVTEATHRWENIVADIGSTLPTVTVDFVNSSTVEYVSGLPLCQGGSSEQRGFSFANVNVTSSGVSGSNSTGTVSFDWSFGDNGETLSGSIRRLAGGIELSGSAQLSRQRSLSCPSVVDLGSVSIRTGGKAGGRLLDPEAVLTDILDVFLFRHGLGGRAREAFAIENVGDSPIQMQSWGREGNYVPLPVELWEGAGAFSAGTSFGPGLILAPGQTLSFTLVAAAPWVLRGLPLGLLEMRAFFMSTGGDCDVKVVMRLVD